MSTARRGARASRSLLLSLLLAACGGPSEAVRTCSTDAECGPGARCVQSSCVTNRPPLATLHLPSAITSDRLVAFDASATDPDPGDSVFRFSWTVTPASAPCEAEPEPGAGPRLELVFWCAGAYEVSVVAEDARGGTSPPARQVVEVSPATGAPTVTPGAERSVEHACGGVPFACRPASAGSPIPLALSAAVDDPAGGPLTYRWRTVPPAGADPAATVTYARGETSLSTEAWVATPGGPVAGTWRFRLRASNAAGLLGQADQVVQVGNRPPVVAVQPLLLDHRCEGGAYLASGALPLPASDPDGDLVTLTTALEEGAAGCTSHLGPVVGETLPFDTRCVTPTQLIGVAGRTIRVVASDGNGGTTELAVPVEIGNRPPQVRLASNPAGGQVALDHAVGPCPGAAGSCFLAAGTAVFEVVDPDGDPVTGPAVAATLAPGLPFSTGQATTAGGLTTFVFATAVDHPASFRNAGGGTLFSLTATGADAFGASTSLVAPIHIGNRPPVLKTARGSAVVPHRYDPARHAYVATAALATFEDPDGDPLSAPQSTGDDACATFSFTSGDGQVECARAYAPAPGLPPLASFLGNHAVVLRAFDGWEGATSPTTVSVQGGPPTAAPFDGSVEACICICPKWNADETACQGVPSWEADIASVPLPVNAADADGDPLQVTFSPAVESGSQKTALPPSCRDVLRNPSIPITVQITVDDGVGQAHTTSRVSGVTCATAGEPCTL